MGRLARCGAEIEGLIARIILEQLSTSAAARAYLPYRAHRLYQHDSPHTGTLPGNHDSRRPRLCRMERRAMVLRAGKKTRARWPHAIASAATLYDVGFNHFWQAPGDKHGGDLVYFQGHSAPGVYARAFLEGRLTEAQLDMFRQEVDGKGVSSYPHPWLMPDCWQFPTVSMGLGPIQATTRRGSWHLGTAWLTDRGWAFRATAMDEPSVGRHRLVRESLDNLVFVINCNLQRSTVRCVATARSSRSSRPRSAAPDGM
jgi:pyruvate dehydrogenase E1 component